MDETPIASESFVLGGRQPIDWNIAVAPVKSGARALEVRLELLHQLHLGNGAHDGIHVLAILEKQNAGNRADVEPDRRLLVGIDIELGHLHSALILLR